MKPNEIRKFLIDVTEKKGGHIGANLSTIELTCALNNIFNFKKDWVIFDTGHQGYTYKILTGRKDSLWKLNDDGGTSRFIDRSESKLDRIDASHAGTALSIATGVASVEEDNWTIVVVGDGSLVEGMTWEGLNYAIKCKKLIILLNDNEIAIDKNVGAINNIMTSKSCDKLSKSLFESMGFNYYFVDDGHSVNSIEKALISAKKEINTPSIIHVKTIKGYGLEISKNHPYKLHFSTPYDKNDIKSTSPVPVGKSFSKIVSETILENVDENNKNHFFITAATPYASSLESLNYFIMKITLMLEWQSNN